MSLGLDFGIPNPAVSASKRLEAYIYDFRSALTSTVC